MVATQVLANSTKLRLSAFTLFYFAQGVPIGLLSIALPAWLVAQDVSAAQVATLISVSGLPWGFKLVGGPFMDRFAYLAMGFRRPWVLGAQAGLTLAMLSMATIGDPTAHFTAVVAIGFLINCFSALQDVAVDGMAIDLLPETERGRANAFMAAGQVGGYSLFGALDGFLLASYGLPVTALASTAAIGAVFLFVAFVREREGERILPWTAGEPAPRLDMPAKSFGMIVKDLARVLFLPMSLVLTSAEFVARMGAGIMLAVLPLIAVQELQYSSEHYSYWVSIASAISAFVGIFFGPLIDRFGAKRLMITGFGAGTVTTLIFAMAHSTWSNGTFLASMLVAANIASQLAIVASFAAFMSICWNKVAATQYSVYMALANLARSVGAGLYGLIAIYISNVQAIYIIAGLFAVAGFIALAFDRQVHANGIQGLIDADSAASS